MGSAGTTVQKKWSKLTRGQATGVGRAGAGLVGQGILVARIEGRIEMLRREVVENRGAVVVKWQ